MQSSENKTVFSGVQPTGSLHIGNYLGAIKNFVDLQDNYECIYCIVDLHAITVWQDPKALKNNIVEVAAAYLASGLDPDKVTIFVQSTVSAHSELAWIFNCVSRMGWLNRMTQFKEKAGKNRENASAGLYVYPNLMASDILLYKAGYVPVGDDQKQHLEITRDIAKKFNNDFSAHGGDKFFPIPDPLILPVASRVMSLRDGTKKMSKSDNSSMSRINLLDDDDLIRKKISKAKTDSLPLPNSQEDLTQRPEAANLINIFSSLSGIKREEIIVKYSGKQFSEFKSDLSEVMIRQLSPIRDELIRLKKDKIFIEKILNEGQAKAEERALKVIREVREIIGLW